MSARHRPTAALAVLVIALLALPGVASARPADDSTGPRSALVAEPADARPDGRPHRHQGQRPRAADRPRRRRPADRDRRNGLRDGPPRAGPPAPALTRTTTSTKGRVP